MKKTREVQSTCIQIYLRVVKPHLNVMDLYNKNYNSVMKNCCKIYEMNLFVQVTEDMPASKRTVVYTRHLLDYPCRDCLLDQPDGHG